jgi:1,4-dihydroxy-2-naphthoate octaprenyltransferase
VALNAISWYILALAPLIYLALNVSFMVIPVGIAGMLITFWYSKAKFNWTHELSLGIATGPLPVLIGMSATSGSPPWLTGLVVSVPFALISSFIGLAIDEWPDAEANLKKGVKSISYMIWKNGISLEWYLSSWILFMFLYQVFLIAIGIAKPLSAISFLTMPFLMSAMVMLKQDFRKWAGIIVLIGVLYPVLIVVGQAFSG